MRRDRPVRRERRPRDDRVPRLARARPTARTLDEVLCDARARLRRLTPADALAASREGGLLVDTRSDDTRRELGVVPGSIHIPRSVLEWRTAPGSAWRNPYVGDDRRLILLCDHGESSSLAAASLLDLGLDVTDVVGGFEAWVASGLPVAPPTRSRTPGELPGMGPPEPL